MSMRVQKYKKKNCPKKVILGILQNVHLKMVHISVVLLTIQLNVMKL